MATAIVVDDSPVMRRCLRTLLEEVGCTVVGEGANGDDVILLYERFRPSLITVDIVMPGRDGVSAATELLKKHPDAVVVMCTSLTARDKIIACQRAGVAHYLLKPFQSDKVKNTVRLVLARSLGPVAVKVA